MAPAGFWRRYAAWSLDTALLAAPVLALLAAWPQWQADLARACAAWEALLHAVGRGLGEAVMAGELFALPSRLLDDAAMPAAAHTLSDALFALLWPPVLGFAALGAAYHAAFEASAWQATPGQRALALRVTGLDGRRIGAGRALLRHVAGLLSWLTLNLGHAMALARPQRRALHDHVAGTRVLQPRETMPLPVWARAWLLLQLLASLAAIATLQVAGSAAMQAGMDAMLWPG